MLTCDDLANCYNHTFTIFRIKLEHANNFRKALEESIVKLRVELDKLLKVWNVSKTNMIFESMFLWGSLRLNTLVLWGLSWSLIFTQVANWYIIGWFVNTMGIVQHTTSWLLDFTSWILFALVSGKTFHHEDSRHIKHICRLSHVDLAYKKRKEHFTMCTCKIFSF